MADSENRIFDVEAIAAAGMKAGIFYPLSPNELIRLPFASELFMLPGRKAVGFNAVSGQLEETEYNPVAAFISPGYTVTYNTAYIEGAEARHAAPLLPLFSYAAVCWYKGNFYVAAVKIERERRQDLRLMDMALMRRNIKRFIRLFPKNRLVRHLSSCAANYGCPAAINFFLERYECPLPTSHTCNSSCAGCISVRHSDSCPEVQPRIKFVPRPEEIAEVALRHIKAVNKPVVSFGQGCEGEPLMVAGVLEEAIRLIRKSTKKGVINLNTNASMPFAIKRLRLAGLDSIRVSMNSVREKFYNLYYKPKGYAFNGVVSSINIMKALGGFVSVNYLVMPGFSDLKEEAAEFFDFIRKNKIDMIQWRNLNYDPVDYFRKMKIGAGNRHACSLHIGVRQLIEQTRRYFPKLRHGYFNPRKI